MIHLWDVAMGKDLLQIPDHGGWQNTLAFSPHGSRLASAQKDTTILLWDVSAAIRRGRAPQNELKPKDLDRLWSDLAGEDVPLAHRALWTLAASSSTVLPFLKEHLKQVPKIGPERLHRLIANLDSQSFANREAASKELTNLGIEAHPALQEALKQQLSLEARKRVEAILKAPPARTIESSDALRSVRAIQVLEMIGSAEARKILDDLAQGAPGARETQEARLSLDCLAKRERQTTPP